VTTPVVPKPRIGRFPIRWLLYVYAFTISLKFGAEPAGPEETDVHVAAAKGLIDPEVLLRKNSPAGGIEI